MGVGVTKCTPAHVQGFVISTIFGILDRHTQRKRCCQVGPSLLRDDDVCMPSFSSLHSRVYLSIIIGIISFTHPQEEVWPSGPNFVE